MNNELKLGKCITLGGFVFLLMSVAIVCVCI